MSNLAMIPNWQFIADPAKNPSITDQALTSEQYNKRYIIKAPGGLGYVMVDTQRSQRALEGVLDVFRAGGWVYQHRTAISIGGAALLGLGVLGWVLR
jgi:hypothetical protein